MSKHLGHLRDILVTFLKRCETRGGNECDSRHSNLRVGMKHVNTSMINVLVCPFVCLF